MFDLVPNATFHNGEPFTPDDVVYTFQRILDPATASAYASLFDSIDTVTKTGDAQVTFTLKTPFGPFLTNLANNGQIVNQAAIEAGDPSRNPVGTGPFKFVEWVQGQHVTLEKNPDYFIEGKPAFDGVELRFLLVDQGRIDGLRSGELQWVDAVPLSQLETLSTDEAFNYVTSPTAGIPDFLAMNVTAAPFDQAEVRQAVAWALDRTAIRDVAYFGAGEVGLAEVPERLDVVRRRRRLRRRTRHRAGPRTARCRRDHRGDHGQLPRPAAVPGAAQDRRGRPRAAQGDRHQHGDRAGRRVRVVRPLQLRRLPDHLGVPGAHRRPGQLLLARRQDRRRRQRDAVLQPRPRRDDRRRPPGDRRRRAQDDVRRDPPDRPGGSAVDLRALRDDQLPDDATTSSAPA